MSRNLPLLLANQDITANEVKFKSIRRYFIVVILTIVSTTVILYFVYNYQNLKQHELDSTYSTILYVAVF
jgi:hypothetical protein